MKKQTAVEWLATYLKGITSLNCDEVIAKAKELEKQQIQKAYIKGQSDCDMFTMESEVEQYYNDTYL
jgi:hypothetical protein